MPRISDTSESVASVAALSRFSYIRGEAVSYLNKPSPASLWALLWPSVVKHHTAAVLFAIVNPGAAKYHPSNLLIV